MTTRYIYPKYIYNNFYIKKLIDPQRGVYKATHFLSGYSSQFLEGKQRGIRYLFPGLNIGFEATPHKIRYNTICDEYTLLTEEEYLKAVISGKLYMGHLNK